LFYTLENARNEKLRESVYYYGNALDTAEIVLIANPSAHAIDINRYINTAIELVYILRCCDDLKGKKYIVNSVEQVLTTYLYPADIQLLMKPIIHTVYAPMPSVKHKMELLFAKDDNKKNIIH
jgi:hypothetical protein